MHRRLATGLLLSGTLAAGAALRIRPVSAQVAGATPGATGLANLTPAELDARTLGAMAFAVVSSELAATRAENPNVRTFAALEAEEQAAFARGRAMAGLPTPAATMMDASQQTMAQRLQALSGGGFDQAFVQGQILGHEELLVLHRAQLQASSTAAGQLIALLAVPAIRTHLAMLAGIRQQVQGG